MTYYEERLEQDLRRIRERVNEMAGRVEKAVSNAIHAAMTGNHKLAYRTILSDHRVNRLMREIDKLCHSFIALHLPSAGHLRLLSSIIRANIELERIGDYSVTIARESVQLSSPPAGAVAQEIERISDLTLAMLRQAIKAFNQNDGETAKATILMADHLEQNLDAVYAGLSAGSEKAQIKDLLAIFVIFNMLKRVADQAKNLCEETAFAALGETKAVKRYRVLFLDPDNGCLGPMAQALARKSYPSSGDYHTAGKQAASRVHPATTAFCENHGLDLNGIEPRRLDLTEREIADFHVVVALRGEISSYLPSVPFHTTALEWDVAPPPLNLTEEEEHKRLEEIYRDLAVQIRDLMETLRGKEAD